jgi:hypothetical protein
MSFETLIAFLRAQLRAEPARFVAYGVAAAVWGVTRLGIVAGVTVPDDVTLAVSTIVTFLLTEIIRRLVFSPATVDTLVNVNTPPAPDGGLPEA